jgi:hypothetical protein
MTLDDGNGAVGPLPDRLEAHLADFGRKRIGADDQNGGTGLQLLLQQACGALCAGDDVAGVRSEAHVTQVLGDFGRSSGRVVGDEQDAGPDYRQGLDGAFGWFMAAENGAVEIEK